MKVNIKKIRNAYNDNYYNLEVEARKGFTKEEYQRIKVSMQVIVTIMNPKILKELAKKRFPK